MLRHRPPGVRALSKDDWRARTRAIPRGTMDPITYQGTSPGPSHHPPDPTLERQATRARQFVHLGELSRIECSPRFDALPQQDVPHCHCTLLWKLYKGQTGSVHRSERFNMERGGKARWCHQPNTLQCRIGTCHAKMESQVGSSWAW